jgi:hypothetical protein
MECVHPLAQPDNSQEEAVLTPEQFDCVVAQLTEAVLAEIRSELASAGSLSSVV